MTVVLSVLAFMFPLDAHPRTQGGRDRPPNVSETKRGRVRVDRRVKIVRPYNAKLTRMAACESGGRWHISTGNGFHGGLQFMASTWRSVGGRGLPHWHSPLEQKYRAVILIRRAGYGPWPICGRR